MALEIEENIDNLEIEDETLGERLLGLSEMFPETVRSFSGSIFNSSVSASKSLYKWSRSGLWIVASTFTILILPIICEEQRASIEEQQAKQQRELLLGPSAATSSAAGAPMPLGFAPVK
ncbi:mitochondrial import receptor subunit TOM22 -like protein [Brachionus plicatilis]|uniref:Mitochondrial import receptor subunit TOM22 homolog n=1 Tax=Brachionus plicatilis TaxID=10195 RepID=A0A3M7SFA0_BRAPC|nr:mitochondrial import receptor subunit TOM22 -like protein [Brachionus plicatilis]